METIVIDRPPPTGEGLTFEKVWAMFQESDRRREEERQKEAAERRKEYEERQKEAEERQKEYDERQKKLDKKFDDLNQQMGGLHNSFGELAEHLVAPGIAEKFNEMGCHFDGIASGGYEILDDQKKVIAEVDILLENGDCIMAVEVKSKLKEKDIEHHEKRLQILRDHRNKKRDTRKIYGAIACAIWSAGEKQAAIDAGFYVLEQTGDTMQMAIPDNFVPKEW
ncbi:MAG: hypothetical protein FWD36_02270 [Treponema sp.]|nr:hypothetical protein [Treponema sp.]